MGYFADDNIKLLSSRTISSDLASIKCAINEKDIIDIYFKGTRENVQGYNFEFGFEDKNNKKYEYKCKIIERSPQFWYEKHNIVQQIKLIPTKYSCYQGDVYIHREFSNKAFYYFVSSSESDMALSLHVEGNNDSCNLENEDELYIPDNEGELIEYLNTIKFPVGIDDVYRNVCKISFGNDMNMYSKFRLDISSTRNFPATAYPGQPWSGRNQTEFTDIIEFENGKLSVFGMSYDGVSVFINDSKFCDNYVLVAEPFGFWKYNINMNKALSKRAVEFLSAKAYDLFDDEATNKEHREELNPLVKKLVFKSTQTQCD